MRSVRPRAVRKMRTILLGAALGVASLGAFAPNTPAHACTGAVCNAACDIVNSKVGQKVFPNGCPLR